MYVKYNIFYKCSNCKYKRKEIYNLFRQIFQRFIRTNAKYDLTIFNSLNLNQKLIQSIQSKQPPNFIYFTRIFSTFNINHLIKIPLKFLNKKNIYIN